MKRRGLRFIALSLASAVLLVACAKVLGLAPPSAPTAFAHRKHVLAGVSCTRCHAGMDQAGDTGELHLPDDATCVSSGCHERPHNPNPCQTCHRDPGAAWGAASAKAHIRFSHAAHVPSTSGNCARCHIGVSAADSPLRPPMAACWNCHEHDRARTTSDCGACHINLRDEGTVPISHIVHEDNYAQAHGLHAAAAAQTCANCHREEFCASCHGVTAPVIAARLRPADPMTTSVHRPAFLARHGEEARVEPAACASCHAPDRCVACHTEQGVTGARAGSPHGVGWVGVGRNDHGSAARRDPVACASCHGGAGEVLCVSCHMVGGPGGSPHPIGWSSRQSVAALPCRLCHTGMP